MTLSVFQKVINVAYMAQFAMTALSAMPRRYMSLIFNNPEFHGIGSMAHRIAGTMARPAIQPRRRRCPNCDVDLNLRKNVTTMELPWTCPTCKYSRAWNEAMDDPSSIGNLQDKREKCNHTRDDGSKAVKVYGAGKHGRYATCSMCDRRWKELTDGMWKVHDRETSGARSSRSSFPWPPPSAAASSSSPAPASKAGLTGSRSLSSRLAAAAGLQAPQAPPPPPPPATAKASVSSDSAQTKRRAPRGDDEMSVVVSDGELSDKAERLRRQRAAAQVAAHVRIDTDSDESFAWLDEEVPPEA